MIGWRSMIVVVSLAQVAVGVACWYWDPDPETGRFGLAVCLAVGLLGLVCQGTSFLRSAAIGANALLAIVFVPGLLGRIVVRLVVWFAPDSLPPGIDTGIGTDLLAAGMVGGGVSALGLWRLSAPRGRGQVEPDAAPAQEAGT
jgi:hypothetical protein